jgi:hypothetical protein
MIGAAMLPHDKPVSEIIRPNAEDENGKYWDPWEALGLPCCSYNSDIDENALAVLRGMESATYATDIAERTGMSPAHVELLQSIFCSAGWGEYGTSPRGCWPIDRDGFPALIAAWEAYYERQWGEPATAESASPKPSQGDTE